MFLAGSAVADSTNIARLRAVGLAPEQTREIDAIYAKGTSAGQTVSSIVPISSPTPGINVLYPGDNLVPATPTANTAVFVGPATPIPGQEFVVENQSPSTIRLKAAGAATMNLQGSAGGWVDLLTLRRAHCKTLSTTQQTCVMAAAYATPQ